MITEVLVNIRDIVEARNISLEPLINVCTYGTTTLTPDKPITSNDRLNYAYPRHHPAFHHLQYRKKRRDEIKAIFSYTASSRKLGGAWE